MLKPTEWSFIGSFFFLCLSLVQLLFASCQGRLSAKQMAKSGLKPGFPATKHGAAIFGDPVLMTIVMGFIAYYMGCWFSRQIIESLLTGLVISSFHHLFKVKIKPVEITGHLYEPGRMTGVGWLHFAYMSLAIAGLMLFYCFTQPQRWHLMVVTICLTIFVPISIVQPSKHYYFDGKTPLGAKLAWFFTPVIWLLGYLKW